MAKYRERNPFAEITLQEANEMKYRNDYAIAIEIYDQVLEIDPQNVRVFHSKGNAMGSAWQI